MRRLLLLLVIATVWCSCSSSGEADDFGMEMYYELTFEFWDVWGNIG